MILLRRLLLVAGLGLWALNLIGLAIPLGHPDIVNEQLPPPVRLAAPARTQGDIVNLTDADMRAAMRRRAGETDAAYVTRMTEAVYRRMAHFWVTPEVDKYDLRIPPTENYLLYAASFVAPQSFRRYEYFDHHKALERGLGYCSQHAVTLAGLLEAQGIRTRVILFTRHTIAAAEVEPGTWWVVDPNYGVIMPHTLETLQRDPELIASAYLAEGFATEHVRGFIIPALTATPRIGDGPGGYHHLRQYYEPASYMLIWVIPAVLIFVARSRPAARVAAA